VSKVVKNNAKAAVSILSRHESSQGKDSLNSQSAWLISIIVFLISLTCLVLPLQMATVYEWYSWESYISFWIFWRNMWRVGTSLFNTLHSVHFETLLYLVQNLKTVHLMWFFVKKGYLMEISAALSELPIPVPCILRGNWHFSPLQRHIYLNNSSGLLIYIKVLNIKRDLTASCCQFHSNSIQQFKTKMQNRVYRLKYTVWGGAIT